MFRKEKETKMKMEGKVRRRREAKKEIEEKTLSQRKNFIKIQNNQ